MPNPVTHFEVLGADAKKLQSFYGGLFGWSIDTNNPMSYGMVQPQEGKGTGGGIGPSLDGQPHVTFYVEVEDPQTALDRAVSLGGNVVMPVTQMDEVVIAQFSDPEGNVVGVARMQENA